MKELNKSRLFAAGCIAILATAMTFAIRTELISVLGTQFNLSASEMGWVSGTAFWGFTISMVIGGLVLDKIGMRNIIILALIGHLSGVLLTIYASGFTSLFISTLLIGIANGFVEAAINPLVATIYPDNKTTKLNLLHVWFPGGIVIGGLIVHFFHLLEWNWQLQMAMIFIPIIAYGALLLPLAFPKTERETSGVSTKEMFKELSRPLFLLMVFTMMFTAATELGTNQWIVSLLKNATGSPIILLVFISGIMVVGRLLAGKVESMFSTVGMLLFSAVFSSIGLFLLSYLSGGSLFIGAGIFALGICYFWPTMLGFVAEYLPKTGAMGLSIMGGAGMLSVAVLLPFMGYLYDFNTAEAVPNNVTVEQLKVALPNTKEGLEFIKIQLDAGKTTLRMVAIVPLMLIMIFSWLYVFQKKQLSNEK